MAKSEPLNKDVARIKARWLRRVMYESRATSTEKCFAYAMADHLNCVTLDCWPAQTTLAKLLGCKSLKTIQRAARGLEAKGLIVIKPRIDGAPGYRYAPTFLSSDEDKSGKASRHSCAEATDTNGRESSSYIHIQSESSSTSSSTLCCPTNGQRPAFNPKQRGLAELAVAQLIGADGMDVLSRLSSIDDAIVNRLCRAYVERTIGPRELAAARLAADQLGTSSALNSSKRYSQSSRASHRERAS